MCIIQHLTLPVTWQLCSVSYQTLNPLRKSWFRDWWSTTGNYPLKASAHLVHVSQQKNSKFVVNPIWTESWELNLWLLYFALWLVYKIAPPSWPIRCLITTNYVLVPRIFPCMMPVACTAVFALSFYQLTAVVTFDLIGHWLSSKELLISHPLALCRHIDGILMCFEKIHKSINVDQPKADVFSQGTHY